jgi:hypothetical protein
MRLLAWLRGWRRQPKPKLCPQDLAREAEERARRAREATKREELAQARLKVLKVRAEYMMGMGKDQ